ncbi:MAG: metallophosphoesterase [Akkermansiaceae bacterium]
MRVPLCLTFLLFSFESLFAHDGPTPMVHYSFDQRFLRDGTLIAQQGPDLALQKTNTIVTKHGLGFPGTGLIPRATAQVLPKETFTISTWCSLEEGTRYGGIIGCYEDNGNYEKGWLLGYDDSRFVVTLSTEATNDGNGKNVFLAASEPFQPNTYYHLAATYDGAELTLYLNGKKSASSKVPGGAIVMPDHRRLSVAGYLDKDESHAMKGELISAAIYEDVATAEWVAKEFAHHASLITTEPADLRKHQPLTVVISPYLQFTTTDAITVMWETSKRGTGRVFYGETAECTQQVDLTTEGPIHELRITGLKPGTQYFYRTETQAEGTDGPQEVASAVRTFQTDGGPEIPYAFAIISDTQGNPSVSGKLAQMAWSHRPNFLLHPGDLVSTGRRKKEWVGQFFSSMEPLVSRVAFFPVLGNHEQNAANYYNYVSLPDPEYFYTFQHGNAQFFMIDTNKKCDPRSEQYLWLEKQLQASQATWKIVCHHHPGYTSDENDYGDLWKTNKSTRGDLNARHLGHLAHRYGVDIIWNGHIHSYERTWPLNQGKAVEKNGTIHLITGGGGGHLETPGPFRTPFGQVVQRGHHYAMVWINGRHFEYKAYDLEGRLFDQFTLRK